MADYNALGGLAQGLAQGMGTGIQLGFMARKYQMQEKKLQLAQQAAVLERQKEEAKLNLEKFGKVTDLYNKTPDSLKPDIWKRAVAPMSNQLFGTDFDPDNHPVSASKFMGDAGKVITGIHKGDFSLNDGLFMLGELRTKMVAAGETDASKTMGDIIADLPGVTDAKGAGSKPKPAEAAKRVSEILTKVATVDQADKVTIDMVANHPELAAAIGKPMSPELKLQMLSAYSNEIELLNPSLPEANRYKAITRKEFEKLSTKYSPAEIMGTRLYLKD